MIETNPSCEKYRLSLSLSLNSYSIPGYFPMDHSCIFSLLFICLKYFPQKKCLESKRDVYFILWSQFLVPHFIFQEASALMMVATLSKRFQSATNYLKHSIGKSIRSKPGYFSWFKYDYLNYCFFMRVYKSITQYS